MSVGVGHNQPRKSRDTVVRGIHGRRKPRHAGPAHRKGFGLEGESVTHPTKGRETQPRERRSGSLQGARSRVSAKEDEASESTRWATIAWGSRGGRHPASAKRIFGSGRTNGATRRSDPPSSFGGTKPRPAEGRMEVPLHMDAAGDEGVRCSSSWGRPGSEAALALRSSEAPEGSFTGQRGGSSEPYRAARCSSMKHRGCRLAGRARGSCCAAKACRRRLVTREDVSADSGGT